MEAELTWGRRLASAVHTMHQVGLWKQLNEMAKILGRELGRPWYVALGLCTYVLTCSRLCSAESSNCIVWLAYEVSQRLTDMSMGNAFKLQCEGFHSEKKFSLQN